VSQGSILAKVGGGLLIGWAIAAAASLAAEPAAAYLGPSALVASKDGRVLYVACADAKRVILVDIPRRAAVRAIDVPDEPTGLALSPDGRRLYVTCAAPESTVVAIDTASQKITASIGAGHTAMAPAVTPDGRRLFVCNRFNNDVSEIEPAAGKEIARIKVTREPVAAAVTPDGRMLVVANHLPDGRADRFYIAAVVSLVDLPSRRVLPIPLPDGSMSVRGLSISPDGRYAFVTHLLANYQLTTTHIEQGWMNTNVVSVVDLAKREFLNTVHLDHLLLGAANPWGVTCTADGRWLVIAHAGTHELSVIDLPAMLKKLWEIYPSRVAGGMPGNPGILGDMRRRIPLAGNGPRELAVVGSKVFAAAYFSDTLEVLDLSAPGAARPSVIPLGPPPRWNDQRRGEMVFNDGTVSYQHWQSCASCHPDARTDALIWDLPNDGVGNSKKTKSMMLAHMTPPAMSLGVRATAEIAVRSGLKTTMFSDRPEEDAAAIDEYLKALRPIPSPYLIRGKLSAAAQRGQRLFESRRTGCARCHPAPLFTDLQSHDVGTQNEQELESRFDTPTLIEVWRTAPYLHDGRYETMREMLLREKRHGSVEHLSPQEIDDLAEFVLSL
jgi:YVTN family beta-propeller protein